MPPLADLASYRLLRALRAGQPGAFPTLWNSQAGAVWSVVRALCATDTEAVGWMTTFRVELAEHGFDLDTPIAEQFGAALHAHLHRHFDHDAPLPEGRLAADESGLRQVPEYARLLYLVDLFFDLGPEVARVAGRDGARTLDAVRRLFSAEDDTEERLAVHATLLRTPPAEALILPPGDEPEVPRFRFWPWTLGGALVLLLSAVLLWGNAGASRWEDLAALHAEAIGARPLLEGDPVDLGMALLRQGVPAVLAEAPDLGALDLVLLGAHVRKGRHPVVALLYHGPDGTWTLQHHLHGPRPEGAPLATADGVEVHDAGGVPAAAWTEAGATWVLAADAPPARVAEMGARILEMRHAASLPPPVPTKGPP